MLAVLGDAHVPSRASEIPREFIVLIQKIKVQKILFAGDATEQYVLDELEKIAPLLSVEGNCDWIHLPTKHILEFAGKKIGLIHGSSVHPRGNPEMLSEIAKKLGVEVLISGHTHKFSINRTNDILLINPGSCTGAWGAVSEGNSPSMLLLSEKKIFHYWFEGKDLKKEEFDW